MNDHELLRCLRAGDEVAFEAIFRAHYPALVAFAERMLRQRATAEDVVQDVLAEVWRRRNGLHVTSSLRAYLFRATRNRALNHLRHEKLVERSAVDQPIGHVPPSPPDSLAEREIDVALQRAVRSLPPRCREVFELSRGHGLKYAEIADALGISVKTVEVQMGKALRVLRRELASWLPGSEEKHPPG